VNTEQIKDTVRRRYGAFAAAGVDFATEAGNPWKARP
jgi:hypothetical protein